MPGPPISRGRRTYPNLKSKRLVYISGSEIFRYIESHPYQCIQLVTYHERSEELVTESAELPGKFKQPTAPRFSEMIREVQFWNCEGYTDGERVRI